MAKRSVVSLCSLSVWATGAVDGSWYCGSCSQRSGLPGATSKIVAVCSMSRSYVTMSNPLGFLLEHGMFACCSHRPFAHGAPGAVSLLPPWVLVSHLCCVLPLWRAPANSASISKRKNKMAEDPMLWVNTDQACLRFWVPHNCCSTM